VALFAVRLSLSVVRDKYLILYETVIEMRMLPINQGSIITVVLLQCTVLLIYRGGFVLVCLLDRGTVTDHELIPARNESLAAGMQGSACGSNVHYYRT
jgi:hypothetical protein